MVFTQVPLEDLSVDWHQSTELSLLSIFMPPVSLLQVFLCICLGAIHRIGMFFYNDLERKKTILMVRGTNKVLCVVLVFIRGQNKVQFYL